MKGVFVTATDTGAGKTVVSCALISALRRTGLRVAGMKPVASGCEQTANGLISDDARQLADASGLGLPMDLVNSYRFLPAIAPHVTAAEAGTRIELPRIETVFL
jgi:dethiobiotin synthetase